MMRQFVGERFRAHNMWAAVLLATLWLCQIAEAQIDLPVTLSPGATTTLSPCHQNFQTLAIAGGAVLGVGLVLAGIMCFASKKNKKILMLAILIAFLSFMAGIVLLAIGTTGAEEECDVDEEDPLLDDPLSTINDTLSPQPTESTSEPATLEELIGAAALGCTGLLLYCRKAEKLKTTVRPHSGMCCLLRSGLLLMIVMFLLLVVGAEAPTSGRKATSVMAALFSFMMYVTFCNSPHLLIRHFYFILLICTDCHCVTIVVTVARSPCMAYLAAQRIGSRNASKCRLLLGSVPSSF